MAREPMKKSTVIWVCMLAFFPFEFLVKLRSQPAPALTAPPTKVSFDWWYPNGKLTTNGGQIFELVASPVDVGPMTNWPVVATFPGNITNGDATVFTADGHYFFAMNISNIYGKVFFSNLV